MELNKSLPLTVFNELYQDMTDKIFTDLILVLTDQHKSISINVHKNILACSSIYFYKCLTFNNNNEAKLVVHVTDALIARDIILSFYNQNINSTDYPDWKYLLKTIKCRNFFCLPNDAKLLYELKVPAEGFELLLEVMDLFDLNNDIRLIKTIKKNIPDNYDYNHFSKEFVNKYLKNENTKIISASVNGNIKIWDEKTGDILDVFDDCGYVRKIVVSPNKLEIMCQGMGSKRVSVRNINTGELLDNFRMNTFVNALAYSQDGQKIIIIDIGGIIEIYNANTCEILNYFDIHRKVDLVAFSSDRQKIIMGKKFNSRKFKIFDVVSCKLKNICIREKSKIDYAILSSDDLNIVAYHNEYLNIWNIATGALINTFKICKNKICGETSSMHDHIVAFSTDKLKIVTAEPNEINIWSTETGELINSFERHEKNINCVAFSNDNQKIICTDGDCINLYNAATGELISSPHNSIDYYYLNDISCLAVI